MQSAVVRVGICVRLVNALDEIPHLVSIFNIHGLGGLPDSVWSWKLTVGDVHAIYFVLDELSIDQFVEVQFVVGVGSLQEVAVMGKGVVLDCEKALFGKAGQHFHELQNASITVLGMLRKPLDPRELFLRSGLPILQNGEVAATDTRCFRLFKAHFQHGLVLESAAVESRFGELFLRKLKKFQSASFRLVDDC